MNADKNTTKTCQMTVEKPMFSTAGGYVVYEKCGKPAKYRNTEPFMGVEYL